MFLEDLHRYNIIVMYNVGSLRLPRGRVNRYTVVQGGDIEVKSSERTQVRDI